MIILINIMKSYNANLSDENARRFEQLTSEGIVSGMDDLVRTAIAQRWNELTPEVIELLSAEEGTYKTQSDWIKYFNKQGKRMISAPDIYKAGKSDSKELRNSLKKDFFESRIVSSTRIIYTPNLHNPNDLGARIVHNFGSTVINPKEKIIAEIPIYEGESVKSVVEGKGLPYVRAIFDTKDRKYKILDTLQELCEESPENIKFSTPDLTLRRTYPERNVGFLNVNFKFFVVSGDGISDFSGGRSRGVSINPRSRYAKK